MYLKWTFRLTIWLLAVLFGPIGYFITKYTGALDSIYGNSVDGLGGDAPYRNKEAKTWLRKLWPNFWWSVVRNPANNLTRPLSPTGIGTSVEHNGSFSTAVIAGEKLCFYYTPTGTVMWKLGYKLWEGDALQVGKQFTAKLAFSLQRGR